MATIVTTMTIISFNLLFLVLSELVMATVAIKITTTTIAIANTIAIISMNLPLLISDVLAITTGAIAATTTTAKTKLAMILPLLVLGVQAIAIAAVTTAIAIHLLYLVLGKLTMAIVAAIPTIAIAIETIPIFLDLRKAYDTVLDREQLLEILEGYGVGPNRLGLLKFYWDNQSCVAKCRKYHENFLFLIVVQHRAVLCPPLVPMYL